MIARTRLVALALVLIAVGALVWPVVRNTFASPSPTVSLTSHYDTDDTTPRHVFLPADTTKQLTATTPNPDPNGLPEIYMQLRWRSGQTLRWYISVNETDDPAFDDHIMAAADTWESKIPLLDWSDTQESSQSTADVLFELQSVCAPGAVGSYRITVEPESADTWRRANYVTKATICVDSDVEYSGYYDRIEILLHEMGHAYGLHERYLLDYTYYPDYPPAFVGCNNREVTVMDAFDCDNLSVPTSLDADRVDSFWHLGWPNAPAIGADVAKTSADTFQLYEVSPGFLRTIWGDWA